MRLLKWNGGDVCLIDVTGKPPPYAILSHTWGPAETEVIYRDMRTNTAKDKPGYDKIRFCGTQAQRDQLEYFWIDTCCINKESSAELQESLNSMFDWYANSQQCYVYLSDISKVTQQPSLAPATISWEISFRSCKWFSRGWTLQELIAPKTVTFFSKESELLGDKETLESLIHDITGIPVQVLQRSRPLSEFSERDRFAWMEKRETTRPEDKVYALLGIFDVFVPLMYGQGQEKVLNQLKEEIERNRIRNISITDADNYLLDDYYNDTRLRIERLSSERLDMEHCYINLAIIERVQEKTTGPTEGDRPHNSSPFDLFHRLKVNEPAPNIKVKLPELFDSYQDSNGRKKPSRRILIRGRAGVGKTTLCKRIVFGFKRRELWSNLFDRLLWVPLRSLKTWSSDHCDSREFFYHHFYRHHPFGQDLVERLERVIGRSEQQGEDQRTLFILDGLDEVSQTWNPGDPKHDFLVKLLNQPSVIITSRPHARIPQDADRPIDLELETTGFYPDQVKEYLEMAFQNADEVIKVQNVLKKYPVIQGLVRVPILLDAFCYSWDSFGLSGDQAAPQTMTAFYQAIVRNLLKKDIVRLEKIDDGQVVTNTIAATLLPLQLDRLAKKEVYLLENLAFTGIINDMIDFEPGTRDIVLRISKSHDDIELPDQSLRHLSFLRTSDLHQVGHDVSYHFLHLTFQEFFAARYFVRQWISRESLRCLNLRNSKAVEKELQTIHPTAFLAQYKYEARYNIFWRFVAGLLDGQDSKETIHFFQMIQDYQSRDLLGPAHQRLIMHCLGEISVQVKLRPALEMTLEKWLVFEIELTGSSILARATEFPDQILLNVLKKKGNTIAQAVLGALRNWPSLPDIFLPYILSWLKDPDYSIRWAAAHVLSNRVYDPQVRQALLARLNDDPDDIVRRAITTALGRQADNPQVRQAVLALLKDPDDEIRLAIVHALEGQANDFQVQQAFLDRLNNDPRYFVQCAAARALSSQIDNHQLRQTLLALLKGPNSNTQGAIVSALKGQADDPQVRQALLDRLNDNPNDLVRRAITTALGSQTDNPQVGQAVLALLKDPDGDIRLDMGRALEGQADNPEVRQALLALLEDPYGDVRLVIAGTLEGQADDPQVRQALLVLLKDPSSEVRWVTARALESQASDPQVRQALLALLEDLDSEVRWVTGRALGGQADDPQVRQALLALLEDPDDEVRWVTAGVLEGQADDPQVRQALLALLEDPDDDIRLATTGALNGQADNPQVRQALLARLEDPKDMVARAAANAVLRSKHSGFPALSKKRTQRLYTILLEMSFEDQWGWQIQSGISRLITPWGVKETLIRDDQKFAKKIKQARPAGYPEDNGKKEERRFSLSRDKIPLIRKFWQRNR